MEEHFPKTSNHANYRMKSEISICLIAGACNTTYKRNYIIVFQNNVDRSFKTERTRIEIVVSVENVLM